MAADKEGHSEQQAAAERRKSAMASTRKRFLSLIATSAGASLTGCGYGFVPANNSAPADPLMIQMTDAQKKLLTFFQSVQTDTALQSRFIDDPTGSMVAYGAIPAPTKAEISKTNRLLFYLLSKPQLQSDFVSAAMDSPGVGGNLRRVQNKFTGQNANISAVQEAVEGFNSAPDREETVARQLRVLMFDEKFREILGVDLEAGEVQGYAARLANDLEQFGRIRPQTIPLLNIIANANLVFNVNLTFNANLSANINLNANANINANTNTGAGCDTGICEYVSMPPDTWHRYLSQLVQHADAMAAQS